MVKKYYWLKLQENFFEREEVKVIEMQANGDKYIIFYLKLLLKSISTNGKLMFRNIIPYTPEMLSKITGTDVDTVKVAIDMFIKLGLLEQLDDGALFMLETNNMTGAETKWAEKKRTQREKKKQGLLKESTEDNVPLLSNDVRQEKELDKEKEKELDKEINNNNNNLGDVFNHLTNCGFRLSPIQISSLQEDLKVYGGVWIKEAAKISADNGKINYSYMKAILDNWLSNGKGGNRKNADRGNVSAELKDEGIGI